MPFPLLAHQAPILPLKMWRPRWFSGTGLVVGSFAPDLSNLVLFGRPERATWTSQSHSIVGLFVFCVPVSMLIVWSFARWVAEPFARHLRHGPPFYLEDIRLAALRVCGASDWARIATSTLVGAASHVAMDSFTRGTGFVTHAWPWLASRARFGSIEITPARALQYCSTAVLGVASAGIAIHLLRRRMLRAWSGDAASAARPFGRVQSARYWTVVSVTSAVGFALAVPIVHDGARYFEHPRIYAWMAVLFLTSCVFYVGLCVAGASVLDRSAANSNTDGP